MADSLSRIFLALEILQAVDSVTGIDLAKRLGVDVRTVQRYMGRLRALGVPVAASPGVGGCYRLRPGYRLPPLLLSNEEAFALSLGLRALRQIGLETLAPATEGTLAKLSRVMPQHLRESIRTVEDAVTMEPSPWLAPAPAECLTGASLAVRAGRRLRFDYCAHSGETTGRTVEPYAVLYADGRWYLIGMCCSRHALRTFRLDRMSGLTVLGEEFERPEDFNARAYFAAKMPFVSEEYAIDVWIDMTAEEATQSFALWRVAVEADGAGVRLRCGRDRLEMFAAMMLATGRRVKVHSPPELRDTFRQLAAAAQAAASS